MVNTQPDLWKQIQNTIDTIPLDQNAEVNILADRQRWKILAVRGPAETMLAASNQELEGNDLSCLYPRGRLEPNTIPFGPNLLEKAAYHGQTIIGRFDGSHLKAAVRVHPFVTSQGNALVFLRILDVTQQLQLNQELRQVHKALKDAYAKLAEQSKSLDEARRAASLSQFAAGLAHELNNPMGIAMSNLSSLNSILREIVSEHFSSQFPEGLKEAIEISKDVSSAVRRVSDIIKALRQLEAKVKWEDFDLAALLKMKGKQLGLSSIRIPKTCRLESDSATILNAVTHIITNARQACEPNGKVRLRLRVDQDNVFIMVEDDGPGIDPQIVERVFEPFFTTRPPGQGLGLGLFLAQRAVASLGGEIRIEAKATPGTLVVLSLPRKRPHIPDLKTSYEQLRTGDKR